MKATMKLMFTLAFLVCCVPDVHAQQRKKALPEKIPDGFWTPRAGCPNPSSCEDKATWQGANRQITIEWFAEAGVVVTYHAASAGMTVTTHTDGTKSVAYHYLLPTVCSSSQGRKPCFLWVETNNASKQQDLSTQSWAAKAIAEYEKTYGKIQP